VGKTAPQRSQAKAPLSSEALPGADAMTGGVPGALLAGEDDADEPPSALGWMAGLTLWSTKMCICKDLMSW